MMKEIFENLSQNTLQLKKVVKNLELDHILYLRFSAKNKGAQVKSEKSFALIHILCEKICWKVLWSRSLFLKT
jgi:hypothetical protein